MKIKGQIIISILCLVILTACGGGGGGDFAGVTGAQGQRIHINSPSDSSQFEVGGTIPLSLATENFTLRSPAGATSSSAPEGGDATEGYYRIYLDDIDNDFVLASVNNIDYTLSGFILPGMHTLRIELRDRSHNIVGAESVLTFEVVRR